MRLLRDGVFKMLNGEIEAYNPFSKEVLEDAHQLSSLQRTVPAKSFFSSNVLSSKQALGWKGRE